MELFLRAAHARRSWVMPILFAFYAAVAAADTVPVTTGLVLNLHNDAGVTADENGFVSAWADQSSMGNDVTQANIDRQPQLVTGVTNGTKTFDVLRFDGVDDVLTRNFTSKQARYDTWRTNFGQAVSPGDNGDYNHDGNVDTADYVIWRESETVAGLPSNLAPGGTVFIVSRTSNKDLAGGQVSLVYGKDNNNRFHTGNSATALNTRWRSGGGGATATSTVALVNDTFYVEAATWDGPGNPALFLHILLPDGTLNTRSTSVQDSTAFLNNPAPMELDLGAMGTIATGAGTTFVGDIAEVLIYNPALSVDDRTAVMNYLGVKYGVLPDESEGSGVSFHGGISITIPEPTTWRVCLIACSIFAFTTRSFLGRC